MVGSVKDSAMDATRPKPNFTGTWHCTSCEGFKEYLDAMRVPEPVRKSILASGFKPTQTITHDGDKLEWCVDAVKGKVVSVQHIGRPTVAKNLNTEVTEVARWENDVWVVDVMQGSHVQLEQRRWFEGDVMYHTMSTRGPNPVTVIRAFERAPSTNGRGLPVSSGAAEASGGGRGGAWMGGGRAGAGAGRGPARGSGKPDFTGRWEAVHCEGFDEYLAASGLDAKVRAALVAKMSKPVHELKMVEDRLEVKVVSSSGDMRSEQCCGQTVINTQNRSVTKEHTYWGGASADVWTVDVENVKTGMRSQQRRWLDGQYMFYDVSVTGNTQATVKRKFVRIDDAGARGAAGLGTGRAAHPSAAGPPAGALAAPPSAAAQPAGSSAAAAAPEPAPDPAPGRLPTPSSKMKTVVVEEEVLENERYMPFAGWSGAYLLPTDRRKWSTGDGRCSSDRFPDVKALPPGWQWESEWVVDTTGVEQNLRDLEGWSYAVDFDWLARPLRQGDGTQAAMCYVRRRRWVRRRKCKVMEKEAEAMAVYKGEGSGSVTYTSEKQVGRAAGRVLVRAGIWLSDEQAVLTITSGHRLVLQNVHLVGCLLCLLCGFVLGQVLASMNDRLYVQMLLKQ